MLVADGLIAEVGPRAGPRRPAPPVLDADGRHRRPGFVDLHTHLREPGGEDAETIETGARAGALGGYTGAGGHAQHQPADRHGGGGRAGAAGRAGRALPGASRRAASPRAGPARSWLPSGELHDLGVRIFTDDGTCVADAGLMRRALEYARALPGAVLAQHCEDPQLARGGHMHEGAWSSWLGIPGMPAEAESVVVARDIALAGLTGGRVHFLHLSTAASVELVRAAKARGLAVTAEAAPHHFTLTDSLCCGYDPLFKVNPPLRTEGDVKAVKEGLADGTIDAIATDHAPHPGPGEGAPLRRGAPGDAGPGDRPGPHPHRAGRARPARPAPGPGPAVLAAGPPGRPRRPRRPGRAGPARPPLRLRPRSRLGGRPHPPGQPVPQHPLRRPQADRPGPPHPPGRRAGRDRQPGPALTSCPPRAAGAGDLSNRRSSVPASGTEERQNGGRIGPAPAGSQLAFLSCRTGGTEERRFVGRGVRRDGPTVRPEPALLVLADGAEFEGEAIGAFTDPEAELSVATGRVRVQHRDVGLPGGAHRPVLRRAGRHLHLSPHRELRHQPGRRRERPASTAPASSSASWPAGRRTGAPRRASTPSSAATVSPGWPASTPAGSPATSATTAPFPAPSAPTRPRCGRRPPPPRAPTGSTSWPPSPAPEPYLAPGSHPDAPFSVVAYDFGIKTSILRRLTAAGCRVEVVPASTKADDVLARRPDGVFLSNGPGDPAGVVGAPDAIRGLLGEVPVFGICLGHQLLGLALGGTTTKLPFGHHGANHPVRRTGRRRRWRSRARTTTTPSTPTRLEGAEVTHVNLNDGVVEGLHVERLRAFSVQYHPEAAPGPHDAAYLFDDFTALDGGQSR